MLDVAIVGAGLSGLALAERLFASKPNLAIFEARDRCGGRILSQAIPSAPNLNVDLGPTWLWPDQQPLIRALAEKLGLQLFKQWDSGHSLYQINAGSEPAQYTDSETHRSARRIEGGCQQLVTGLLQALPDTVLHLQHRLLRVANRGTHVELEFSTAAGREYYQARQLVLAAPPRLLAENIAFEPALAPKLMRMMQDTPTWMAGHAKALLVYQQAFWRQQGYSGNALLHYPGAVLAEVYDASPAAGESAALFGFFGLPAAIRDYYRDTLEDLVVQQMTRLFGEAAANPQQVLIQDWSQEAFTATADDRIAPPAHPSYGHLWLQLDHWQDKLYFCGTETAASDGGYLEGALVAADRVFNALTL